MTIAPLSSSARSFAADDGWRAAAPAVGAGLLLFCLALFSQTVLGDGDTFWHLTAGEWIIAHRAVPTTDPFTFSMPGAPWTAHEWLSEVLMAYSYRLAGWSGVLILTATAIGSTAYVAGRRLARDLDGLALVTVLTLGLALLVPSLLARPHILALPVLAVWASALFQARDEDRSPSLALLPLMTIWANMHGSFIFGFALLGPMALEALIAAPAGKKLTAVRGWVLFGLLALAAALVHPLGYETLLFPIKLMGLKSLSHVLEWRPESFDTLGPVEIDLLALIGFALYRPMRVAPVRMLLLLGLIHLALHHTRHATILGLIAPMILARPIAEAVGCHPEAQRALTRVQSAVFLALFVVASLVRVAIPVKRVDGPTAPISALAAVPAELRERPGLNHYNFGGYLIYSGVKPFVDGRTDMYGDEFLEKFFHLAAADPKALDETLDKFNIAWTMFPPDEPVVRLLDARPGWTRLYKDEFAVIHVRNDAMPLELRK
jgi:hypothetical protein